MFTEAPTTSHQRARWMALCQLIDDGVYYNQHQILADLAEKGFDIHPYTLAKDRRACNIGKFQGVYTRLPIGTAQEAVTLLKARMTIGLASIFRSGDVVVMNTSRGAGPWIADVLRETQERFLLSVMNDQDTVWALAPEGHGRTLENRLGELWREGPDEGLKKHPSAHTNQARTRKAGRKPKPKE